MFGRAPTATSTREFNGSAWSTVEHLGGLSSSRASRPRPMRLGRPTSFVAATTTASGGTAVDERRRVGGPGSSIGGELRVRSRRGQPTRRRSTCSVACAGNGRSGTRGTSTAAASTACRRSAGNVDSDPSPRCRPDRASYVFARGSDQAIWYRRASCGGCSGPWMSLGGSLTSDPVVCHRRIGVHVFVRDGDERDLRTRRFGGNLGRTGSRRRHRHVRPRRASAALRARRRRAGHRQRASGTAGSQRLVVGLASLARRNANRRSRSRSATHRRVRLRPRARQRRSGTARSPPASWSGWHVARRWLVAARARSTDPCGSRWSRSRRGRARASLGRSSGAARSTRPPGAPAGQRRARARADDRQGRGRRAVGAPVDGRVAILIQNGSTKPARIDLVTATSTRADGGRVDAGTERRGRSRRWSRRASLRWRRCSSVATTFRAGRGDRGEGAQHAGRGIAGRRGRSTVGDLVLSAAEDRHRRADARRHGHERHHQLDRARHQGRGDVLRRGAATDDDHDGPARRPAKVAAGKHATIVGAVDAPLPDLPRRRPTAS